MDAKLPTDAPVPINQAGKPAGVLVDGGTNRRIPFAIKADLSSGYYEYLVPAPDGRNVLVDELARPIVRQGRAVGKLVLEPIGKAAALGLYKEPSKKVYSPLQPMTKDEKVAGLEQYKEVYIKVWNELRQVDRREVDAKWAQYLSTNKFLDCMVLKRRHVKAGP